MSEEIKQTDILGTGTGAFIKGRNTGKRFDGMLHSSDSEINENSYSGNAIVVDVKEMDGEEVTEFNDIHRFSQFDQSKMKGKSLLIFEDPVIMGRILPMDDIMGTGIIEEE